MRTSEEAKTYACEVTSRCLTGEESERRLQYFRRQLDGATTKEMKDIWRSQIEKVETWLTSEKFLTGNFAHGIDELMLELIEWRALKYAFQNVQTEQSPFMDHVFFMQWLIGGTYAVFALLGKLVSNTRGDSSLRRLWSTVSDSIRKDGACSDEEIKHINQNIFGSSGYFASNGSRALQYRHFVVAHNVRNPTLKWSEIDKDIEILVRIWSIIGSWSSFGLYEPFRTPDQAISGLDPYFSPYELKRLKDTRQEYLNRVTQWSLNYLHNGQRDPARGIFSKLVVTALRFPNR
jgi:hypothetical protein